MSIPNIPHESVPVGETEDDNVEIRNGERSVILNLKPKPHWDVADHLGILILNVQAKLQAAALFFIKDLEHVRAGT